MTHQNTSNANQLIISGLKEIIGPKELTGIIATGLTGEKSISDNESAIQILPDRDLWIIQELLEKRFGLKELQGLLLRTGRASCKFFVKEYGPNMSVTSIEYRLMPSKKRLLIGLKAAAGMCSELFNKEISVDDEDDAWMWRENKPRHKQPKQSSGQEGYFTIGLLQEYMAWLSGGKAFSVRMAEVSSSTENGCCLKISKQPIE